MKKTILFLLLLCVTSQVGAYEFNGKEYNIKVPGNIYFIQRSCMTHRMDENTYGCKIIKLNDLLIKNYLEPLYK